MRYKYLLSHPTVGSISGEGVSPDVTSALRAIMHKSGLPWETAILDSPAAVNVQSTRKLKIGYEELDWEPPRNVLITVTFTHSRT